MVTLTGVVIDEDGEPVVRARVSATPGGGAVTDLEGNFRILNLKRGKMILLVTAANYPAQRDTIVLSADTSIRIEMRRSTVSGQEVIVEGETEAEAVGRSIIAVESVDLREAQVEATSSTQVLNRVAGVKIRTDGGLGSGASININGLEGKAVRIFRDGIPVDYLGRSFDLSLVPVNMLERVEIYKGVLPIEFGLDALGGAINLISRPQFGTSLVTSYEIASFGTHRISLQGSISRDSNFGAFFSGFFNSAENNYPITALVIDTATAQRRPKTVTRFHDGIANGFIEGGVSFRGLAENDRVRATLGYSTLRKEFQHGALMTQAYGEAIGEEEGMLASLRYDLPLSQANDRFSFFAGYGSFTSLFVDTATRKYGWEGNVIAEGINTGEIENEHTLQTIDLDIVTARVHANYHLLDNLNSFVAVNHTRSTRVGEDPYASPDFSNGIIIITVPASNDRTIAGGGMQLSLLDSTLDLTAGYKLYSYGSTGLGTYTYSKDPLTNRGSHTGYLAAARYQFSPELMVRLGYERASRIPDQEEIFGDNRFLLSNFELGPEQSNNINLGFLYEDRFHQFGNTRIEVSGFYRKLEDLIKLDVSIPFSIYRNQGAGTVIGGEFEASTDFFYWWSIAGNMTVQDARRVDITDQSAKYLEGSRLPNMPYFFYNVMNRFDLREILGTPMPLALYYQFSHVHEYYLSAIPTFLESDNFFGRAKVESELIIPTQDIHTAGVTMSVPSYGVNLGLEVRNLTDARLYDSFRIQKPGRSIHLKIGYGMYSF